MTIENLKQIAIKYATTKGSRVPLAPDELCNAVVQYFNEFLKITADINTLQVAVTEEGGNIVFTITGNTLDGKAFTPIVITVDHNDFVTDQEFEEFKTSVTEQLNNKLNKITSPISNFVLYGNIEGNDTQIIFTSVSATNSVLYRDVSGKTAVVKGVSGQDVANMENIADLEEKIPDVTNLATKDELNNKLDKSNWSATVYIVDSQGIQNNVAYTSNPSPNTFVYRDNNSNFVVNSPTENGNPTPKSYVDNALAGKLDAAGNNTFTGENTFTNEITFNTMKSEAGGINFGNFEGIMENGYNYSSLNGYQFVMQKFVGTDDYYETLINADLITYKPAGNNNIYEFHFPNKSGTFAMTTDIIKDPIYFISFYANEPSEPCHLIGTMMSKNSYGTGQKTNEEFAVMLADNLYTNSNEGLAAYGKLAKKDILCIYSDDGLSIRCLDEENSEVDLPTIMFFVMETEL